MKFEFLAPDGCHYENYSDYVWSGLLGFCGCSGESQEMLFSILKKLHKAKKNLLDENYKGNERFYFYEYENVSKEWKGFQELCLMIFDKLGWTEHGSSVRGSWLTSEGYEITKKMEEDNWGVSHD